MINAVSKVAVPVDGQEQAKKFSSFDRLGFEPCRDES